jgi:hypothetical protein
MFNGVHLSMAHDIDMGSQPASITVAHRSESIQEDYQHSLFFFRSRES